MASETNATSADGQPAGRGSYRTIRPTPKGRRHWPYAMRMTFYFALIAVMTAAIFMAVLGVVWERQFYVYARENMQRVATSMAELVGEAYEEEGGWSSEVFAIASDATATSDGVDLRIVDLDGSVLFGNTAEGGDEALLRSLASGAGAVSADVVVKDGGKVGTVVIWAQGSDALLTQADQDFRTGSYQVIILASAVAVCAAVMLGYFVSRNLAKPINKVTKAAAQIRNGNLTARTGLVGEDEIGRLGETFDDMATTIERDITRERRLTGDVAHELRTPLMAMLVTVEAMQDGVLPADDEHLETVASETRRLSRMVDAMLHLSRLENGTRKPTFELTDMVKLCRGMVDTQHQLFHERGIHLRFMDETRGGDCFAEVDPDLMREALTNLMSNAMRYTNESGWVVVSVAQEKGECLMSVQDTGIGIAPEDVSRIFSRFWRSDASRQRVSGGLGVGLAITKEIVDRHNGTISVESVQGQGSTFTIKVPLTHPHSSRENDRSDA